jgi:hypothetical protein
MGTSVKKMGVELFSHLEEFLEMEIDHVVVVETGEEFINPNIAGRQLELF